MGSTMRVAIIGAGFAGLAAAYELQRQASTWQIDLYDPNSTAGGLAIGLRRDNWEWSLEEHYHHAFDTDRAIKQLVAELGLAKELFYKRAKSSTWYKGKIYQVDSPLSLLGFRPLSLWSRLRTGLVLAWLKFWPQGQALERHRALSFLRSSMGAAACRVLWEPLFQKKFAKAAEEVNLAWFWGRIHPRTAKLGYFKGGWQRLADLLVQHLEQRRVRVQLQTQVQQLVKQNDEFVLTVLRAGQAPTLEHYDLVISTLPAPAFAKLVDLPELHSQHLRGLGALTLRLRLGKPFLRDGTYWLNVNDSKWPFLAVVEHTNLIKKRHYGQETIVYVGRYLAADQPDFAKSAEQLLADYTPYLNKLNPQWSKHLLEASLSKAPFAQPIVGVHHSRHLPKMQTSLSNLYWVSMQHIYPFDRGVNYAIATARQLARYVKMKTSSHVN